MRSWIHGNWPVFVVAAGLTVVAGLSLGRPQAPCPALPGTGSTVTEPSQETSNQPTPTNGEEAVFSFTKSPEKTQSVRHVSEADFDREVLQSDVPVLVDFYADWCGPCRLLAPVLQELAAETDGAKIVKVDVDANPGLAAQYGITSIPSVMVFRDGRVAAQHVGLAGKDRLAAMLGS
jgi:thioredoxin 1